jgi:hypothetical protein
MEEDNNWKNQHDAYLQVFKQFRILVSNAFTITSLNKGFNRENLNYSSSFQNSQSTEEF